MLKRTYLVMGLAALAGIGLAVFTAQAAPTGNGAESGSHYTLNIIGVAKDKTADMDGNKGRRIFVRLDGHTKILLSKGDFQVLDANGTDGEASFQLPDPDPDGDGITEYSVYVRELGKPGGSAVMRSCLRDKDGDLGIDPVAGEVYCSTESVVLVRSTGGSKFRNVSKELLSICADTDGDLICDTRVFLFDDDGDDYWWEYDNVGLRLAQLRFYPIPTNVGLNP